MKVAVTNIIELSDTTVVEVAMRYLHALKNGMWIRDGQLMEEVCTSHRFDSVVGGMEHPKYELVATVQRLERLLKESKK